MTDETSPRLQEFQAQVDELKLTGGGANPERTAVRVAVALFIAAVVIEIVAFVGSSNTALGEAGAQEQTDFVILALLGVVLALGAVGLFVRASLTRWFRYWLVRLVYEDRANTDRLIEALRPGAATESTTAQQEQRP